MTVRDLIEYGQTELKAANIEEYENDTRVLIMYVMKFSYSDLIFHMNDEVSEEDELFFKQCIVARTTHMPCQYITGVQEFMGYEFHVAENVLIPRPETELLVEEALKQMEAVPRVKALDMCTGSGCIGISFSLLRRDMKARSLYKEMTGNMDNQDEIHLADISNDAISLAKENNEKLNANCIIKKSDLFENIIDKYDIILSNPPYIKTEEIEKLMEEVRDFEPHLALDGFEDGLYFYDRIIKEARRFLYENGVLIFEIGYDQYEDVRALFVDAGYEGVTLKKDYAGLDRVVFARWRG